MPKKRAVKRTKRAAKPAAIKVSRWIAKDKRGPTAGEVFVYTAHPKFDGEAFYLSGALFGISNEECEALYGFIPKPGECWCVEATATKVK